MKRYTIATALILSLAACSQAPHENLDNIDKNSGLVLENFDTSVRPQDDLYRYVNGNWLAITDIPADKSNYGSFTILADQAREDMRKIIESAAKKSAPDTEEQKVGALYQSFMDTERLESLGMSPLAPELDKINKIEDKQSLAHYFAYARKTGSSAPFGFYINNDSKQPEDYIPYFYHSGLGLPDRDYYFKDDAKSQEIRSAYVRHITNMFTLADFESPAESAATIMALERKIAEAHWQRVNLRNRDLTYNRFNTDTLTALAPAFPWSQYLAAAGLTEQAEVIIIPPSFFEQFDKIFSDTSLADWKTYQRWKLLSQSAELLSPEFDNEHFAFYSRVLAGTEKQEERWKRSVDAVDTVLGELVGKVYVKQHFQPAAKARMQTLVENLRKAYAEAIVELDWMSEATKQQALVKLEKFHPKIGYPDKWRDYSALDIRADDLTGNFRRASIFEYEHNIGKLGQAVNRDEWFMNPQTVNAYYNPVMNEIVFPAAILQPPFFNLNADDAVNYGGIGAVIGHEMGHGFDDQGAKSDGDGVLRNWWNDKDLSEFKKRTGKLADQYAAFEVLPGEFLNGKFTLGENIGDLGGLTIAYRAYQLSLAGKPGPELDGFSADQRFFISWAQVWGRKYRDENLRQRISTDPHSPSEYRTNGVVRNMPEFVEAFDVKEGDKLYLPESERVKIW